MEDLNALKELILLSKQETIDSIKTETKINATISNLTSTVEKLATRVAYVERNCTEHDTRITANNESIEPLDFELNELKTEIHSLKSTNSRLDAEVDEQIDRSMRETLIINCVDGFEKTWEETKTKLCQLLIELSDDYEDDSYTYNDIYENIVRAHRGKKKGEGSTPIFVKFLTGNMVSFVKSLRFKRKNLYINQMRSPFVSARMKQGRDFIKILKQGEGASWSMHINDNVQLVYRCQGEKRFQLYKQF